MSTTTTKKPVVAKTKTTKNAAVVKNDAIAPKKVTKKDDQQTLTRQQILMPSYGVSPFFKKNDATIKTLLKDFDLAWDVELNPIMHKDKAGKIIEIPEKFATVRSDNGNALGIVGRQYRISQNEELINIVSPLLDIKDISIETAGHFQGGRFVYVMLRIPSHITVKTDEVEPFLFIGTSHDGTRKIHIGLTTVRVVCQNTFNYNMNRAQLKIMHSVNMQEKLKSATQVIGMTNDLVAQLNENFNEMQKAKADDKIIDKVIRHMLYAPEKMRIDELSTRKINLYNDMKETIEHEFNSNVTLKGNLYGVFNGITAFYNHSRNFKNEMNRLEHVMIGGSNYENQRVFSFVNSLVK